MEIVYEIGHFHGRICDYLWWDNDGDDAYHIQQVLFLSLVKEGKNPTLELVDVEPDALGKEFQHLDIQVHFRVLSVDMLLYTTISCGIYDSYSVVSQLLEPYWLKHCGPFCH
jgi:hypothetical protein